jgi:hypothetical protein
MALGSLHLFHSLLIFHFRMLNFISYLTGSGLFQGKISLLSQPDGRLN